MLDANKIKTAADWCGVQEDDPKPIIYLSGVPPGITFEDVYNKTQYRYYCMSYMYSAPESARHHRKCSTGLDFMLRNNLRVFIDSGAHTFHEIVYSKMGTVGKTKKSSADKLRAASTVRQQVYDYAKQYAAWLQRLGTQGLDFYVTLDYVTHSAATVYEMHQHLVDKLKIRPIPVYHGDSSISWMQRYIDEGHKLIGIGWTPTAHGHSAKRRYYDQVFNYAAKRSVHLHGFACTGGNLFTYPWYSVDSATWIKEAAFGHVIEFISDSNGMPKYKQTDISDEQLHGMPKDDPDLKARVEARGYDLAELRGNYVARALFNIKSYQLAAERYSHRSRLQWKGTLC